MVKVYICKLSAQEIATDAFEMHEESMAEFTDGQVISLTAKEVWYNNDDMCCMTDSQYADLEDKSVVEKVLDIAQQYQLEETPLIKSKASYVKIMKLYLKKVLATLETKPEKKAFRTNAQKFIMKLAGPDAEPIKDSNYSFYVRRVMPAGRRATRRSLSASGSGAWSRSSTSSRLASAFRSTEQPINRCN